MNRRFALAALALAAAEPLSAQSIFDVGARAAPQYHSYSIDSPSNTKISEFSFPLYAIMPVSPTFSLDLGTAWAHSHVDQTTNGKTANSNISGFTDTQIRGNYTFGNDFVVLTAGLNLPTGKSSVTPQQELAASLIGSDFLAFPISNMGTGFGGTAGVAVARPFADWNVGGGASLRKSSAYDPFDAGGGPALHYQPGNEYRLRVGADRAVGTGRVAIGLTYSTFGNDNLAGSIYNTGNRYLTTFSFDNTLGAGTLSVIGWNLFRTAGTLADSSYLGHENIADAAVTYGLNMGSATLEPNLEGRLWTQAGGVPTSLMTTLGVRSQMVVMGYAILPSVGYSFGRLAAQDVNGLNTTATLTGYHATLAIRLR